MKFKEIIKDKQLTNAQINKLMDLLDLYEDDNMDLKICFDLMINDNHYSEFTAKQNISEMEAVMYLGPEELLVEAVGMPDYLGKLGVTPESAYELIKEAHNKAIKKANDLGKTAPSLDYNKWDAYRAISMVLSDYWYTVRGQLENAAMIAYEYLSDPDRPKNVPR